MDDLLSWFIGVSGLTAVEATRLINGWVQKYKQDRERGIRKQRIQKLNALIQNGTVTKALRRYYSPGNLKSGDLYSYSFKVDGEVADCSVSTRPEWVHQAIPLDSDKEHCDLVEVSSPRPDVSEEQISQGAKLIGRLIEEGTNRKMSNDQIYRLLDWRFTGDQIDAKFAIDKYFNYRFVDGLLEDELKDALVDYDLNLEILLSDSERLLPLRGRILPTGRSLAELSSRISSGGTLVVLAMASSNGDYVIPIQKRSASVADSQGSRSVIPQAFHSPIVDVEKEIRLSSTVYREIYEELFQGSDAEDPSSRVRHDYFMYESEPMNWLHRHKESCTFELVSAGINLHVGSYETGVLFAIHDPAFFEKYSPRIKANWETKRQSGVEALSSLNTSRIRELLRALDWASEGLFTFVECMTRLKTLKPGNVRLPDLETFGS